MNDIDERDREEALALLQEQLEAEKKLVELYTKTSEFIISGPVKRLLHSLKLDSRKHIEFCQAIIDVLQSDGLPRDEREELMVGVERHLKMEEEAIDRLNTISNNTWISESPGLSELIRKFQNEEREHHEFLLKLASKKFIREDPLDLFTVFRARARGRLWRELRGKK